MESSVSNPFIQAELDLLHETLDIELTTRYIIGIFVLLHVFPDLN